MRRNLAEPALRDLAERGLVDAIEVLNAKTSLRSLNAAGGRVRRRVRPRRRAPAATRTCPNALGAAYVEMPDFDGPTDFLAKLRGGRVVGHHWDERAAVVGADPAERHQPTDVESTDRRRT